MPRRPSLSPARPLEVSLDPLLREKLDTLLFNEIEKRVPYGAYAKFFNKALRAFLEWETLNLAPFGIRGVVKGTPATIQELEKRLIEGSK